MRALDPFRRPIGADRVKLPGTRACPRRGSQHLDELRGDVQLPLDRGLQPIEAYLGGGYHVALSGFQI